MKLYKKSIHKNMQINYKHAHASALTHTRTHTHIHLYIYIYIYIYIYSIVRLLSKLYLYNRVVIGYYAIYINRSCVIAIYLYQL